MKAVEITSYGAPEVLRVAERPDPVPGAGEALIRVAASGVVPPGTEEIEVELHFTVESGVGDGYADQLSLVLRRAP